MYKTAPSRREPLSQDFLEMPISVGTAISDSESWNPRSWSLRKKGFVCIGPIYTAFIGNLAISIYVASIPGVEKEFAVNNTLGILLVSLAALGFFLGPLIAVSISEIYGRRSIFIVSIPVSFAFTVVAGSATHFATLAIARFFANFAIAPAVTVAVGVINDVWDVKVEKLGSVTIVMYAAMQVWATEVGPCAGAAIVRDTENFRWTFWLTAILLGVSMLTLFNPETYAPEILRKREMKAGRSPPTRGSAITLLRVASGRAVHMLFVEPIVWPTAIMNGLYGAIIYCFYITYPLIFQRVYHFDTYQVGLSFLSLLVGSVIGLVIVAVIDKRVYQKAVNTAQRLGTVVKPESRLYPALIGSVLMPIGLFWFAWTAKSKFHWTVPLMSGLPIGISLMCIMLCLPVYKNDVYGTEYGASALAADSIVRYLFCFAVPLFTVQMVDRLGFQWAGSLLGFLSLVLMPVPFVIFRLGPGLRRKSRYVPRK